MQVLNHLCDTEMNTALPCPPEEIRGGGEAKTGGGETRKVCLEEFMSTLVLMKQRTGGRFRQGK